MRRAAFAVAVALLVLVLPIESAGTPEDELTLVEECAVSGEGWWDPIVFPGVVGDASAPWYGKSHFHSFAGSLPSPTSTGFDLLGQQARCTDARDRSAYWVPRVLAGGYYTTVSRVRVSYEFEPPPPPTERAISRICRAFPRLCERFPDLRELPDGRHAKVCARFPRLCERYLTPNADPSVLVPDGVGLIAGSAKWNDPEDVDLEQVFWDCDDGQRSPVPIACSPGGFGAPATPMHETLVFPSCWDGRTLATHQIGGHAGHGAYPYGDGSCPTTHPFRLPRITLEVWYSPVVQHGYTYTQLPTIACYVASDEIRALAEQAYVDLAEKAHVSPSDYADGIYGTYSGSCGHGDVLTAWG